MYICFSRYKVQDYSTVLQTIGSIIYDFHSYLMSIQSTIFGSMTFILTLCHIRVQYLFDPHADDKECLKVKLKTIMNLSCICFREFYRVYMCKHRIIIMASTLGTSFDRTPNEELIFSATVVVSPKPKGN